jgi:hypothetical protein
LRETGKAAVFRLFGEFIDRNGAARKLACLGRIRAPDNIAKVTIAAVAFSTGLSVFEFAPIERCGFQAAEAAFVLTGGIARKAIASRFHALMVAINMVRLTVSVSEKWARISR